MKKFLYIITAAAASLALLSCDKGDEVTDPVFSAARIAGGAEALTVDMNAYVPVDLIWTAGSWTGEGGVSYRALIDKTDGDFSEPLLEIIPQEGTLSVFISQAQISDIWSKVGGKDDVTTDQSFTIKWAVETAGGENVSLSESQDIILNKPYVEPTPVEFELGMPLYIAGEGALEAGQEMSCLYEHPYNTTDGGNYADSQGQNMAVDYEIYTQLNAGKPVYLAYGESFDTPDGYLTFADAAVETIGSYTAITGDMPQNGFTVETTSVYRIRINCTDKQVLVQQIGDAGVRCFGREPNKNGKYNASTTTDFIMTYTGKGTWTYSGLDLKWGGTAFDGRFDGYKFYLTIAGKAQLYGHNDDGNISNPADVEAASQVHLRPVAGGGAAGKSILRYPLTLISADKNPAYSADIVLHLNLDNGEYYYHEFTNETAK